MNLKIHKSYREVVAICDSELIGKYFEKGEFQLDVKESFYKGEEISEEKVKEIIKKMSVEDATFNIESKINFCYIQARDVKREDWIEMLEKVLKRECSIQEIDWNLLKEDPNSWSHDAYIDHQSSSKEGRNTEMFDSEENLMNFIFNPDSYIQGGNDNV